MPDKTKLFTMIGEYPNTSALRAGKIKSDVVDYDFACEFMTKNHLGEKVREVIFSPDACPDAISFKAGTTDLSPLIIISF